MLGHYFTIALRSFRRAPLTTAVNILALALGLAAFVIAYGVVSFWDKSERNFTNVDRTYVVTSDLEANKTGGHQDGRGSRSTNRLYSDYLEGRVPGLRSRRAHADDEQRGGRLRRAT